MSLRRFVNSFGYAAKGIADLFAHHRNAQVHLAVTIAVIFAGVKLHLSAWEWVAVTGCIGIVIALEAINTAIEYVCDLVAPDFHPLAGKAKDMAAGAVLWAAIAAVVIGMFIFLPKI